MHVVGAIRCSRSTRENFVARATPWSFDHVTLEGARGADRPAHGAGAVPAGPLPPVAAPVVELDDLVRFAEHPVAPVPARPPRRPARRRRGGGRRRAAGRARPPRAVARRPAAARGAAARRATRRRASPPSAPAARCRRTALADELLERLRPTVETIAGTRSRSGGGDGAPVDVGVALPDGRALNGAVPGVTGDAAARRRALARVSPRSRIAAWVRLLALTVAHPERRGRR